MFLEVRIERRLNKRYILAKSACGAEGGILSIDSSYHSQCCSSEGGPAPYHLLTSSKVFNSSHEQKPGASGTSNDVRVGQSGALY